MDAKETLKYVYEHGHIISGRNYKIIKDELAENAKLKALLSHSKTQLEYDELQAENAKLKELVEYAAAMDKQATKGILALEAENDKLTEHLLRIDNYCRLNNIDLDEILNPAKDNDNG